MIDPFWTAAEDERLASLLAEGRPLGEIADLMPGRTFYAIGARKHLLGLKALRPRSDCWTPEEDERLRHLWCIEGLSAGQIFNLMPERGSRNAIMGRVHRLGLVKRTQETRKQQNAPCAVERRAAPKKHMIRFGNLSIPKSTVPAPMVPPKPVEASKPLVTGEPVTLLERRFDQCGWPVNDGNPYLFCAAPAEGRYCKHHAAMGVAKRRAA